MSRFDWYLIGERASVVLACVVILLYAIGGIR